MSKLREKMVDVMQLCGLSRGTQTAYLLAVSRLANYYQRNPAKLTEEEVQAFLVHLIKEKGLAASTQNAIASGLRFFYGKVLGRHEMFIWIPRRKTPQVQPEVLSHRELKRLFDAAETPKVRALFMTLYAAGLRAHEALGLEVDDIDSDRMVLRVREGKGQKERYTVLTAELLWMLRQYWMLERSPRLLFPGADKERPLSVRSAGRAYARAKLNADIKKRGGVHTLRHCFATHLIEQNVPIKTVQVLLGHSSIRSTSRYIHVARTDLGEEHSLLAQIPGLEVKAIGPTR